MYRTRRAALSPRVLRRLGRRRPRGGGAPPGGGKPPGRIPTPGLRDVAEGVYGASKYICPGSEFGEAGKAAVDGASIYISAKYRQHLIDAHEGVPDENCPVCKFFQQGR